MCDLRDLFGGETTSLSSQRFLNIWKLTGGFHDAAISRSSFVSNIWTLNLNEIYFPSLGVYNAYNTHGALFLFHSCSDMTLQIAKLFDGQDIFEITFTKETVSFVFSFDGTEVKNLKVNLDKSCFRWEFR